MKTTKIEFNDQIYNVIVCETEEEREIGLQNVESMDDNEGCLFIHPKSESVSYWMFETSIPLTIIFFNKNQEVVSYAQGIPNDKTPIQEDNVKYVLEINPTENVKIGDEFEFEDDFDESWIEDDELEPGRNLQSKYMDIYGPDGKVQAQIVGGERILSISDTRTLVKMARKAYTTKKESDYKRLGKKIFEYLHIQDTNQPEYVEQKTKKESE